MPCFVYRCLVSRIVIALSDCRPDRMTTPADPLPRGLVTKGWGKAVLPGYIKLLDVLWAENGMALGSCHAFAKPANGVRPQASPSGWHVPLEALIAPLPGAPPDEVGRVHSTEFIVHHILAGSTLLWRLAYDIRHRCPRKWACLRPRLLQPSPGALSASSWRASP
jgi:hypothetical protein